MVKSSSELQELRREELRRSPSIWFALGVALGVFGGPLLSDLFESMPVLLFFLSCLVGFNLLLRLVAVVSGESDG